jgi:trigger factor
VEVPEDPKARTLAPGEYSVTVTRVARREVPAVDDELAKHFGLQTLEELRAKIRADLEAEAQGRSRRTQEEKVVGALLGRYPFAVPPTQVERQLRSDLEELAGSLAQRGVDVGRSLDWEKVAESRRPDSERQVRTYYLLQEVAKGGGMSVAEEEVEAYFAERAAAAGRPEVTPKTVREAYAKEGRLDSVRQLLLHRKALDLLLSQASVTFEEGRPDKEEEIHAHDPVRGGADEPR